MKIGIDLGGSHIAIGLVDENGKIIEKVEKNIKLNDNLISEIEPFIIENIMQFKLLKPIVWKLFCFKCWILGLSIINDQCSSYSRDFKNNSIAEA